MNNLIGISGKIGSGKNTVAEIIQYLNCSPPSQDDINHMLNFIAGGKYKSNLNRYSNYQIKRFEDKLKDMVCILLGCTREQLEDRDFKEKELGEKWWYYKTSNGLVSYTDYEAMRPLVEFKHDEELIKLTPLKLLQLFGTNCGIDIIHPNIWINALFADYKSPCYDAETQKPCSCMGQMCGKPLNWIITDVRFPDEVKAIESRGGIVIRVNNKNFEEKAIKHFGKTPGHISETALDNHDFKYVIENDGSLEELIEKVKQLKLTNDE